MLELQRQILLPPQNAGPSGPVAAMGLPVPIVAPVRPLSAQKRWTVQTILLRPESAGAHEVAE